MRSRVLILLFSIVSFLVKAQFQSYFNEVDTIETALKISSENYFQSNFITGQVASDIVFSRFITDETKSYLLDRKGPYNHALFEANQQIGFNYRLNSQMGIGLNVEDRILGYGSFFDDVVILAVFGNRNIGAKNFRVNDSYFNLVRFQTFKPNFTYQFKPNQKLSFAIGLINGTRLIQASAPNTNIYISEFGDYLEMNVNGSFISSDTANTGFLANNGNGLSFDISYQLEFSWVKNTSLNGFLQVFAQDVGFIKYNERSIAYEQENEYYNYEGVQIQDITNYPSRIFREQSPDTIIDDLLAQNTNLSPTFSLPFTLGITHYQEITNKSFLNYGIVYRNMVNYRPMGFVKYQSKLSNLLSLNGNCHFLGMGNFAVGGGVDLDWKNLQFSINTANLNGLIFKQSYTGLGVFGNLKYRL